MTDLELELLAIRKRKEFVEKIIAELEKDDWTDLVFMAKSPAPRGDNLDTQTHVTVLHQGSSLFTQMGMCDYIKQDILGYLNDHS